MHPRITRLHIDNYRCFVNFAMEPRQRNLLLGYNGAGKSSIFDVLAGIQDIVVRNKDATEAFPSRTLSMFDSNHIQSFTIDIGSDHGTFRYDLTLVHYTDRDVAEIAHEQVTLEGKPLFTAAVGKVQLYAPDHTPAQARFPFTPRRSFLASMEPGAMDARLLWFKRFIQGIRVLRLDPARMLAAAPVEEDFLAHDASNFAAWCRNLLTDAPEDLQRTWESLEQVLDGFESFRAQSFGRSRVLVVKFRKPGGGTYELDFDALSDGQKALIVLYTVLHSATSQASVLCLDEPDNFVSIREIQPFLVELANIGDDTGMQAFFISHSPEVINFLGAEAAILLERPEGAPTRVASLSTDGSLPLSELMARGWHVAA